MKKEQMNYMYEVFKLYEWGAKLFIGGMPATPQMVESKILRKQLNCMPKISFDKKGNISEIQYSYS